MGLGGLAGGFCCIWRDMGFVGCGIYGRMACCGVRAGNITSLRKLGKALEHRHTVCLRSGIRSRNKLYRELRLAMKILTELKYKFQRQRHTSRWHPNVTSLRR